MKIIIISILAMIISGCGSGNVENTQVTSSTNVTTLTPGVTVEIVVNNTSSRNSIVNPSIYLESWLSNIASNQNLNYTGLISPGQNHVFSFYLGDTESVTTNLRDNYQYILSNQTSAVIQLRADNLPNPQNPALTVEVAPDPLSLVLWKDIVINADLWSDTPEIMSAGYGFEGIEGVNQGESYVVAAGGAWELLTMPNPPYDAHTLFHRLIEFAKGNSDLCDLIFNFDLNFTSNGFEENYDYLMQLCAAGIDAIPVTHDILNREYGRFIAAGFTKIAIGQDTNRKDVELLRERVVDMTMSGVSHIHLLGVGTPEKLLSIPIGSCDASSYIQYAKFGIVNYWDNQLDSNNKSGSSGFSVGS